MVSIHWCALPVRSRGWAGAACLVAALAAPAAAHAQALPQSVTREWLIRERLTRPDHAYDDFEVLKDRPGFVRSLVEIAQSEQQPYLNRSNSVLMLGASRRDDSFDFLQRFYDALPANHPLRVIALYAFGSHDAPPPGVLTRLERALGGGAFDESMMAARSLGRIGTDQARGLLSARLGREARPAVRARIENMLRRSRAPVR